ncbi:APC family permease [Thermoplasmatales archaeon AK]|nr:APC family permease [Thermoplasmatales archaeon AK]
MADQSRELKKGVVTYIELIFQSISFTAPAIAVTATMTGAAAFAYGALPLTYVFALFGVLLAGFVVFVFSRKVASSGGYYRYIERGTGLRVGGFGGWVYMLYTVVGATPFIYFETALALQVGLGVLGINVPSWLWYPVGLIVALGAFGLAYSGIKNSLKYSVFTGTIEMVLLLIVAGFILAHTPHPLDGSVFTIKYSPTGWSGVALGLVFSFTSLAGWGSMTFLGTEARSAHVNIRRGVIATILILGIFFLFMSYVMTVGWGPANMSTYFSNFLPGLILALQDGGIVIAVLLFVFLVNSGFVDTLAIINAGSRDMYTMSKDGMLPEKLSLTHPKHKSPHISLIVNTIIGIVIFTITGWLFGPFNGFLVTGVWTGAGTIIEHIMINSSLPLYFRKHRSVKWYYVAAPVAGIAIYLFALYGSFLSVNFYVIVAVVVMVIYLLFGAVYFGVKKGIKVALEQGEEI